MERAYYVTSWNGIAINGSGVNGFMSTRSRSFQIGCECFFVFKTIRS